MDKQKQKRHRRNFSNEFNALAVSLVLKASRSLAQIAKDLSLTASSVGGWVENAIADEAKSRRGSLATDE
jgi:transposase-like protein